MDLIYFEDVVEGEAPQSGKYEVAKEEIIEFARQFDPQPFHLDEEAAKRTLLGGLSASGWHTGAISMRLFYETFVANAASMGGLGIDELKWMKPVRPGDVLSLRRKVIAKRQSQSRSDLGIILMQSAVINQNDDVVMSYSAPVMLRRRGVAQGQAAPDTDSADDAANDAPPKAVAETPAPEFVGLFYEDLVIGQRMDIGSHTYEKDAILAFGRKYDPQPFHVDEAAARKSHFGGLIASGWHTAAGFMGQLINNRKRIRNELQGRGSKLPELGPSPGFNNLRWRAPVYAGDTLRFSSEIISKRAVSRPGWGLVFSRNKGFNQHNRLAYEFEAIAFWQMRP